MTSKVERISDIFKEQTEFLAKMSLLYETTANEDELDTLEEYEFTQITLFAERYFKQSAQLHLSEC